MKKGSAHSGMPDGYASILPVMRREHSFLGPMQLSRSSRRIFMQQMASLAGASVLGARTLASVIPTAPPGIFQEVPASESKIFWAHTAGKSPEKHLPESTGPGCAFLDYDNDGWMDIYLVNSGKCDFYTPKKPLRNALYRNNRDGTFTDVTEQAGVAGGGYGMGVAVGDYDGDGHADIYVTQYGRNILYHNNGDGTFTDVTEKAGVAAPGWSTSAVWFDYDNDGRLDLFVCQFVKIENGLICTVDADGQHHYCIPRIFQPMPSWLFHNNGDGTFTDVSRESGIAASLGKAWGAVAVDVNNDGKLDLFVSNDTVANFLFVNQGGGKFTEEGFDAGVAYSADGRPRSGMGVDATDFDQDGWMDLFVSNINEEIFSLYRNNHDGTFTDIAMPAGIGMPTRWMSGWGVKFFDYDNDGHLDLILANGFPDDAVGQGSRYITYEQPMLLFHGEEKKMKDVSAEAGSAFKRPYSARGLAVGDISNNGALDVLVGINDGPPLLLRNQVGYSSHWLGIRLVGRKCNTDAIGARVTYQAGDLRQTRTKIGGGSFLSSHDPRLVLGIGQRKKMDWVEVHWPQPSGKVERFVDLPLDRYITIVEGAGKWTD